jgi:hypothetical protein
MWLVRVNDIDHTRESVLMLIIKMYKWIDFGFEKTAMQLGGEVGPRWHLSARPAHCCLLFCWTGLRIEV